MIKKGPRAKKSLGQHFLVDKAVVRAAIALARVKATDLVVEIGPGRGILTEDLLEAAGEVLAIELDPRMLAFLREHYPDPKLKLLERDVLEVDWQQVLPEKAKVVANLPYYITSPIIESLLASKELFSTIVLMVQREVAERIAAEPGGRDYGVLSIAVQYHAKVELGPIIGPEAFKPPPKVDSALIKLTPQPAPNFGISEALFFRIVRAAFRQRRKTLLNSLLAANLLEAEDKKEQRTLLEGLVTKVGLDPQQRPETVGLVEYGRLALEFAPHLREELK